MGLIRPVGRAVYRATGRVRWWSLVWGSLMTTLAAVLVAGLLSVCGMLGIYLLVFAPIGAGALVGWLAMLVVRQAHCRNRGLAVLLGVWLGVLAYGGHYHLDMLRKIGMPQWSRFDLLPDYVVQRWKTDRWGHFLKGRPAPALLELNATIAGVELTITATLAAMMAVKAASRPYAEGAGCWMECRAFANLPGSSTAIANALNQRSLGDLQSAIFPVPNLGAGFCQLSFWMCPPSADPEGTEPTLLTMVEFDPPNDDGVQAFRYVTRDWVIEPRETIVFAQQIPTMLEWLQSSSQTRREARRAAASMDSESVFFDGEPLKG